jgi:isopenicillin-N N-acyltransferase-like protein
MRIQDGPAILVLAYPGEILGYGLWSTGMSLFRNSLHSRTGAAQGLTMVQWGLLALAGNTVDEAAALAGKHGLAGSGNFLLSDAQGRSIAVEFNAGGVSVIPAANGVATHANHPEGHETAPFEQFPDEQRRRDSRRRGQLLRELLEAERGRLTPQKALMCLADHTHYPWGICNHLIPERTPPRCTTAAVVAEPARGRLHVTRGNPCANWPATHSM